MSDEIYVSVIIPVFNEEDNVTILHEKLEYELLKLNKPYEIIFIDDGSTDSTFNRLVSLNNIKVIKFKKNFGQTVAMGAGVKHSTGKIIIFMDGDLQNDPTDIKHLIRKLNSGFDVISGWRHDRQDPILKKIISKISNMLRKLLTDDKIHDSGCTLKAFKRECLENFEFYGEMHRWIPTILSWKGYKIGEVKVNHHDRKNGQTKYGMARIIKGFLDMLVVVFWQKYSTRPIHIFGGLGILLSMLGFILGLYLITMKLIFNMSLQNKTTPLLAVFMVVIGLQFFLTGILADITIKNYYSDKDKTTYLIEEVIEK